MIATLSESWRAAEPLVRGLKLSGLMNQSLWQEESFRQGRHHFMTAVNQILEGSLALEQVARCLEAANIPYSLKGWNVAVFLAPMGVAYLASRQIKILHINEAANFVQDHLGKLSLLTMTVATVALFVFGQTVLAVTTLAYLSIGVLDSHNFLSEPTQKFVHRASFFVGTVTGLYLGGHFVRLICISNVVIGAIDKYFDYQRLEEEKKEKERKFLHVKSEENIEENPIETKVSLNELQQLQEDMNYPIGRHTHKKSLPFVDSNVKIKEIVDAYRTINWLEHEHVIKKKLAQDKRWLEVGQFELAPLAYFQRNLIELIDSIEKRNILTGKPDSYEMLEFYCRYIAQELKEQDEIARADLLIKLGIEGGEHCGTGKFGVVEEIYEGLISQSKSLPLEIRVLACEQQERQSIWQRIYQLLWTTNPLFQFFGYISDVNARHHANVFINLVQAGQKFGIPHQAAKNDRTAAINPINHYVAFSFVHVIEEWFWKGGNISQCYVSMENPQEKDWWKVWKWIHLKRENAYSKPYDSEAILKRLESTIGTPQIPKSDIYVWWEQWVQRQTDLDENKKEELINELQDPKIDPLTGKFSITFNNEPFEVNNKIQPKFLRAMLIEMGILNKPLIE